MSKTKSGFTIVELLIVIVVIGILAAITIVAYNGIQDRARTTRRESDLTTYSKAIHLARINTGKVLMDITGSGWSAGSCGSTSGNPGNVEPKNLAKTHICWTTYYDNLDKISAASGANLSGLKAGDPNGNPYTLDENEGESCGQDLIFFNTGPGATIGTGRVIPRTASC